MPRFSQVKNLSVVTVTEGKKIGVVDELRVDPQRLTIAWMRIHSGGLFGRESHWVSRDAITGMGQDLVTIRSESDLQPPAEGADQGQHGRQIVGSRVVTEDGRFLGEIHDFSFSPATYSVTEMIIRQGNAFSSQQATIPGDRLLTVGNDAIVVARDAIPGVEASATPTYDRAGDEGMPGPQETTTQHDWMPPSAGQSTGEPAIRYHNAAEEPPLKPHAHPDEPETRFEPGSETGTDWPNVPPDEANHLGSRETQEPNLDRDAPEGGPTIR